MEGIYQIKEIAFLYRQNRDSQKFACKNIKFNCGDMDYEVKPFNMDKYSNKKTILKRLAEYNYIVVFKYDYDIRKILNELKIDYYVFIPTISEDFLEYFNQFPYSNRMDKAFMENITFDITEETIKRTLSKILNLEQEITIYYVDKGELLSKKLMLEGGSRPFNTDKKKVAKEYVKNMETHINLTESILFNDEAKLRKFKKKYKELLEN